MVDPRTPEILLRFNIRALPIQGVFIIASVASAQDSACVMVRDDVSHHAIVSALVRIDVPRGATREAWSDAAGRACWSPATIASAHRIEAQALGYRRAWRDRRADGTLELSLQRSGVSSSAGANTGEDQWSREQLVLAVALALRDVRSCTGLVYASCASSHTAAVVTPADLSVADSATSAEARARLGQVALPFLETILSRLRLGTGPAPQVLRESSVTTLSTFVDVPDSADRYTELRVAISSGSGRALFGATEMVCKGANCDRRQQVSLRWDVNDDRALVPALAMSTDGASGLVDVFDLSRLASSPGVPARKAGRTLIVRGVVRDDKEHAVSGAQILASLVDVDARTDSTGRFLLVVRTDASAIVLTARALGHVPAFRTAAVARDTGIYWEPRLRSVQQLAERVVSEVGLPPELSSWRYDEMMARRARGQGYFIIGKEIWSSNSIGDALARVPGVRVKMRYGHTIDNIVIPQCSMQKISERFIAPEGKIGVWVNGYEQTRNQSAEDVLAEFSVGSVIAMEVYRGASEIPAEFTGTRYCGVISVWTR